MVKIHPKKRGASQGQMPWPDPVAKRAKKEESEDKKVDLASVPKFEGVGRDNHTPVAPKKSTPLEKLAKAYPPTIFNEVITSRVRQIAQPSGTSSSTNNGNMNAVYVVTHTATGPYTDTQVDILGTYNCLGAANIRVLKFFRNQYGDYMHEWQHDPRLMGNFERNPSGEVNMERVAYWIDDYRCLSLWCNGEDGHYKVCAIKQEVKTDGFAIGISAAYGYKKHEKAQGYDDDDDEDQERRVINHGDF
ncbi:hypothetical protein F4781DRAFT_387252 [Annulohypoxylon bovei var. microspora]|nr:hypothetical protein F4781DRAFT_387252 [Annulohypoxylon bovei var. microspora]